MAQRVLPSILGALLLASACTAPETIVHSPTSLAQSAALQVREGFASTPDGVRLYYRVAGDGGDVVIAPFALYHGSSLDALAHGRQVVTYDPRGRGRSEAVPANKVSLDYLLVDLDTIRRAMGAERVAIIGWSGAGMETFVYALRNPTRVSRLVQLAPVAPRFVPYGPEMMADRQARTDPEMRAAFEARERRGDFAGRPEEQCRALAAVTTPPLLANPASAARIPDVCIWANEHTEALGAYFNALFGSIDGYDWRSSLASVTIPRLVVFPLRDNIPRAGVEEWVRGQPNARLLLVPDSGHFPAYEQPAITIAAIETFLDGSWPAEATSPP